MAELQREGHRLTRLVRGPGGDGKATWDPVGGTIDASAFDGCDAVVNLAGEPLAEHRWSDAHKRAVLESRVKGTALLANTIAGLSQPPSVLASASGIGFYGDRADERLDETSERGTGFLADVVAEWEAATAPAEKAGVRVAHLRTGIVLSTKGGALKQQLLPFKLGAGGRFGSGRQYFSWITIVDEVRAIQHVLATPSLRGAVNLTAPAPATNLEFTKALGAAVHRPTFIPTPLFVVKAIYGAEMVKEMLLASDRVAPRKLIESGFEFSYPELGPALKFLIENRS